VKSDLNTLKLHIHCSSSALLSVGISQSKLHELHVQPINFAIIIASAVKKMTWSDPPLFPLYIFLMIFFFLIALLPSSSMSPFPWACSHYRGTYSPSISGLWLHTPLASVHVSCLAPSLMLMLILKCLFSFRSSDSILSEETNRVKRVVFAM